MRRPAFLFLAALGLAGWAGPDAAARSQGGGDAAAPGREVLAGEVVVQRSTSSANVVAAVDGGAKGEAADGASCARGAATDGAKAAGRARPCPGGGSTDCSNSTCQITCIEGYTACCDCSNPTNCKCSCVRM